MGMGLLPLKLNEWNIYFGAATQCRATFEGAAYTYVFSGSFGSTVDDKGANEWDHVMDG